MKAEDNLYYTLFCRFTQGIGNVKTREIMSSSDGLNRLNLNNPQIRSKVEKELELMSKNNVKAVTLWDDEYPQQLKNIYDPPPLLYYMGNIDLKGLSFAVVGTRKPSKYGIETTKMIVDELCKNKVNIISGFAYGIDSIAHEIALENRFKTVAVLGCGINVQYPYGNRWMREPILENGGAIISEFSMNMQALPANFPVRNRIISGLSDGVLIIEAGERSGSLITAKIALDQGKNIYTIPGSVFGNSFKGNHYLIRLGSVLVENAQQILQDYGFFEVQKEKSPHPAIDKVSQTKTFSKPHFAPNEFEVFSKETKKKEVFPVKEELYKELTKEEFIIYQLLEQKTNIDTLVTYSQYPMGKILSIITTLMIKGLIIEEGGSYFAV
jgi:DNA processing protein